ncbi:hypothetical protein [Aeromonas salmonicida]|uniref:hypothetical protein n=1 Tax=Aeromonas salmonicida TaxID=645 RepID=UPI0038B6BB46
MSKHTKEPWLYFFDCSEPATPHPDSDGVVRLGFDDYERARVCVNACRGLPTDELEQKGLVAAVGNQLLELERQRDDWEMALGTVLATIPVTEIIRAAGTVGDAVAYFTQLHQQRDDLLAALEGVHCIASLSNMTHNMMVIRDQSSAAIAKAKAKGGAT